MNYHFRFDYSTQFKNFSDEDYTRLRASLPTLNPDKAKAQYWDEHVAGAEAMAMIADMKLGIQFVEAKGSEHLMWVRLQDRIRDLELRQDDTAAHVVSGAGVHLHIPDYTLTRVAEVMHLDDACTDDLQGYLDEGWRILAICPPNAKRRPDYILGRSKALS